MSNYLVLTAAEEKYAELEAAAGGGTPTNIQEAQSNPANPVQKHIQNGNVYILSNDKTYNVTGQMVK